MNPLRGCLLLLLALAWPAGAQDLPLYTCWKAAHPPAIDGKGDEVVWQEASPVELVDVSSLSGDRYHPRRTEVRMLWDAQHFYFYFSAADPDVWSTYNQRDMQLYEEEVVEIFIDPDGDGQNYAEVELNPLNAVLDLLLSKPWSQGGKGYDAWNPALRSAVQVSGTLGNAADVDQGWSAEIALPWADLVSPLADVPGGMRLPPSRVTSGASTSTASSRYGRAGPATRYRPAPGRRWAGLISMCPSASAGWSLAAGSPPSTPSPGPRSRPNRNRRVLKTFRPAPRSKRQPNRAAPGVAPATKESER